MDMTVQMDRAPEKTVPLGNGIMEQDHAPARQLQFPVGLHTGPAQPVPHPVSIMIARDQMLAPTEARAIPRHIPPAEIPQAPHVIIRLDASIPVGSQHGIHFRHPGKGPVAMPDYTLVTEMQVGRKPCCHDPETGMKP